MPTAQLYPANPVAASPGTSVETPSITGLADGGWLVTWASENQDGSGWGIFSRRYDADGAPVANSDTRVNLVTDNDQQAPAVTGLSDGGYVVTWKSLLQDGSSWGVYARQYDAAGVSLFTTDTLVNVVTSNEQSQPSVAAFVGGGHVVTWQLLNDTTGGYDIFARRFGADGLALSPTDGTRVNVTRTNNQTEPSVTTFTDGSYLVTWQSFAQSGTPASWDIYGRRFNANGVATTTTDTLINSTTAGNQTNVSAAVLSDGGYVVTWQAPGAAGTDIFARRFDAAGQPAPEGEIRLNVTTTGEQTAPAITALEGGGHVVVWQSNGQDGSVWGVYARRFDADGLATEPAETLVNLRTNGNQTAPTVSALEDGGYVVAFVDDANGIVVAPFRGFDVPEPTPQMPTAPQYAAVNQPFTLTLPADAFVDADSPVLAYSATLADGSPLPADWLSFNPATRSFSGTPQADDLGRQRILVTATDPQGHSASIGFELRVVAELPSGPPDLYPGIPMVASSGTSVETPAITGLADGGWLVTWASENQDGSGWGIYSRRYGADGVAVANSDTRVNVVSDNHQQAPAVTGLGDGGYVVTWKSLLQDGSSWGVYARPYDAAGQALLNADTLVNVQTVNEQSQPSVAALAGGGYVVAWQSLNEVVGVNDIHARRFDANGAALSTTDIRVNTTTANQQVEPAVISLADGSYLVTWQSNEQDGSGYGIYARRFSADGVPLSTDDTRINTTTAGAQTNVSAAALADGGHVMAWQSPAADGSMDIHARRFGADGQPLSATDSLLNQATAGEQTAPAVTALDDGGYVVGWQSLAPDTAAWDIQGIRFDVDGNVVASTNALVNFRAPGNQTAPAVAGLQDGRFVVALDDAASGITLVLFEPDVLPPVAQLADEPHYAAALHPFTLTLPADAFVDPDSPTLTYTATLADGSPLPAAWLSFDPASLTFSGTPPTDALGLLPIRITATDPAGHSASAVLDLRVVPALPREMLAGDEMAVNVHKTNQQLDPATAGLRDGGHVVVWTSTGQDSSGDGVYARVYRADGSAVSTEDILVTGATLDGQIEPAVAALSDGGFVVSWTQQDEEGDPEAVFARRFNAEGVAEGPDLAVSTSATAAAEDSSIIGLNDGGFMVVYRDGNAFARRFDNQGQAEPITQINATTNGGLFPSLAELAGGGMVVVWTSQDASSLSIFAHLLDADGQPLPGPDFAVNVTTNNAQIFPSVTALADGGFVVAWQSLGQDGDGYGIYTRRFDAHGQALASQDTRVNAHTASNQERPSVTALADGGFVVTWQSFGQDLSGSFGIYAQRFDALGQPMGSADLLVNTTTAGNQFDPSVSALADGGFVVAWESLDGNGIGIFQRIFHPAAEDAPVLAQSLDDQAVLTGSPLSYTVPTDAFTDATPGEVLVYSAQLQDPSSPTGLAPLPAWLSFNPQTLQFSGSPGETDVATLNVVVKATDAYGLSAQDVFSLQVALPNQPPVAVDDVLVGNEDAAIEGNLLAANPAFARADGDDDGDTLTIIAVNGVTSDVDKQISLGQRQGLLTVQADGTVTFNPNGGYEALAYNAVATEQFTYTISDGNGATDTATVTLTIQGVNDAPTAPPEPVVLGPIDEDSGEFGITPAMLLNGAADVDGPFAGGPFVYDLTLTSGRGDFREIFYSGAGPNDPVWRYTPAPDDDSSVAFSYTISDGLASVTHTATLDIRSVNDAPQPEPDSALTAPGTAVDIAVLRNDRDIESNSLVVSSLTPGSGGSTSIQPLDALPGQVVRYTPNAGFSGFDRFSYTASDGAGGFASTTVTVLVASHLGTELNDTIFTTAQADVVSSLGGNDYIQTFGGADHVDAGEGQDTVFGGTGADVLMGGGGNDIFYATSLELPGDAIDGGSGVDTLVLTGSTNFILPAFSFSNLEQLSFSNTLQVEQTSWLDLSSLTLTGVGRTITGGFASNQITGSKSNDALNGGGGSDHLNGSGGNDTVQGGTGTDTVNGGLGNDTLAGNTIAAADGAMDTFVFNTALNAATNVDQIVRFEAAGIDRIALDSGIFAAVAANGSTGLDVGEFRSSAGGLAADVDDFILFDTASGNLYYDADGNGGVARVQFASLGSSYTGGVDAADFVVGTWPG